MRDVFLATVVAVFFCMLFWGGSCYVHSCHYHGDDDDHDHGHDDDDDCHHHHDDDDSGDPDPPPAAGGGDLEVRLWERIVFGEPGSAPVRAVFGVQGVAVLPDDLESDPVGLGRAVIEANPHLVGLPDWAGRLVPAGVEHLGTEQRALVWAQVFGDALVPGAEVRLRFTAAGRLVALENGTRLY